MKFNNEALKELGLQRIVANCQLLQETACSIVDYRNPDQNSLDKPMIHRAFIPFGLDIIGEYKKKAEYIGEYGGYLCRFERNYGSEDQPQHLEDISRQHPDSQLLDFTTAILGDKGGMPKQWCRPGEYFILILNFQIYSAFRNCGLGTYLMDNIQKIIHFDCCIPAHCLFIPPPKADPHASEEEIRDCERLKTFLRCQGFREIGHNGAGYFALRVNPDY